MPFWKGLVELAASGLVGGFVGYIAAYLYLSVWSKAPDVIRTDEQRAAYDILDSAGYFKDDRPNRAIIIAGAAAGIFVRLVLLVF